MTSKPSPPYRSKSRVWASTGCRPWDSKITSIYNLQSRTEKSQGDRRTTVKMRKEDNGRAKRAVPISWEGTLRSLNHGSMSSEIPFSHSFNLKLLQLCLRQVWKKIQYIEMMLELGEGLKSHVSNSLSETCYCCESNVKRQRKSINQHGYRVSDSSNSAKTSPLKV